MGVAADKAVFFVERDMMATLQQMGGGDAGHAAADDRNGQRRVRHLRAPFRMTSVTGAGCSHGRNMVQLLGLVCLFVNR
jgi:hypothetical protein